MINPNELRLHNLVLYNGKEHKVEQIGHYEVFIHTMDEETLLSVNPEQLSGIPITEERLIKNEWKTVKDCFYFKNISDILIIHLTLLKGNKGLMSMTQIMNKEETEVLTGFVEVDFWHQLQNLTAELK